METKHTPGPWKLEYSSASGTLDGFRTACIFVEQVVPAGGYRGTVASLQSAEHIEGITYEETEANARLIAAAPELLEAANATREFILKRYGDGIPSELMPYFSRLTAAIAKATKE